jgi:DNA-binding transcriptional LysR family regulator
MAKAAAHLAVSQPAVSKAIADMEHTFGVPLLDRKPQGVEPTLYGEALLKWGDPVFDDLRHAVKEIEHLADPTSGELSIGATLAMIEGMLPVAVDRLSRLYPKIVFRIDQQPTTQERFEELRARKLDLVIGRIPRTLPMEDLKSEILFEEPLHVVASADSSWARRRRIALADLINESWVLPSETAVGSFIAQVFQASGLPFPRRGITYNGLQFTRSMVATGRYLGMFPGSFWHFSSKRSGLKILPVKLPIGAPPVGVVTVKNRTLSPAAKLFIESVREVTKPLSKGKDLSVD